MWISTRCAAVLMFAVASSIAVVKHAEAQQRPQAPYGYIVTYSARDGKLLSDGKQYRIAIVTRNAADALKAFNYYNSIHMYKAVKVDLKTETDYNAALQLQKDPNTGRPKPDGSGTKEEKRPVSGSVAGAKFRVDGTTFTFASDGAVTTSSSTVGRWTQEGDTVRWSIKDGLVFRYTGTLSASRQQMTIKRSVFNPSSGNESQQTPYGTANRIP